MISRREKSAVLGLAANIYLVIVSSIMPFIIRTVLVRYIGIEYVGVSSLFSSVLEVLNVADFGLVGALSYYLFKPAVENDKYNINVYMGFFRKLFFMTGSVILVGGLLVMPFMPYLVKGKEYPTELNIYLIYFIYILQAALPYFLNMHVAMLLTAYLKSYINSIIIATSLLIMYIVQIYFVVYYRDYYLFTFALMVSVGFYGLLYLLAEKRYFPWIDYRGKPSQEFILDFRKRIPAMIISKIRIVTRNSLDCVIISIFLGLTVLAKYQNYFQVMYVPFMITQMLRTAVQPSLGNGIAAESMESNYGIFKQYIFVNCFVSTVCMTCLLSLMQPFMKLWMGEQYLLGNDIVICVAVYYYVLSFSDIVIMLREAAGIWYEGRWVAVLESVLNLILNVIFVRVLGLYGIILATILTVAFINIPLEGYYSIKGCFMNYYRDYMRMTLIYLLKAFITAFVSYMLCTRICVINYGTMLLRIVTSFIVPSIVFIVLNIKNKEMRGAVDLAVRVVKNVR